MLIIMRSEGSRGWGGGGGGGGVFSRAEASSIRLLTRSDS